MALTFFDRPTHKAADPKASIALTTEQIAARQKFSNDLAEKFSEPGFLESIGAFITPGKDADKATMLLALSLMVPAVKFTDPDGASATTRPFNLNINAVVQEPGKSGQGESQALTATPRTFAEIKAAMLAKKAAHK